MTIHSHRHGTSALLFPLHLLPPVAFSIYDLENTGTVSGEDLLVILKMMVGSNITEEQLKAIAQRTMNEADQEGTGMISFDDFAQVGVLGTSQNN